MIVVPLTSVGPLAFGATEKDVVCTLGEPSRRFEASVPFRHTRLRYAAPDLQCLIRESSGLFSVGMGRKENAYFLFGQDMFSDGIVERLREQGIVFQTTHDAFEVTTKSAVALGIDFNFENSQLMYIHCSGADAWREDNRGAEKPKGAG